MSRRVGARQEMDGEIATRRRCGDVATRRSAAEFGPAGVRVNAVSPGPTRTEGTLDMGDALDQLASGGPAGRPGQPEEIAAAIAFLATDDASFIHGALLPVDGGRIAV